MKKVLLVLSLAVAALGTPFATPRSPGNAVSRYDDGNATHYTKAPFTPAQPPRDDYPFNICYDETTTGTNYAHPALFSDCLGVKNWTDLNNGQWRLINPSNNMSAADGWQVLNIYGQCAVLVKYSDVTALGNGDVYDLLSSISYSSSDSHVEMKGTFNLCQDNIQIQYWVRDAKFVVDKNDRQEKNNAVDGLQD
ncbi:hypothetical protein F5Y16DRAFT_373465 [Xylariaceae sp. FL0255]|nr:hypothetical protein F5Y16DRAFT_373465 [Xylariaceae sp. FL0255]